MNIYNEQGELTDVRAIEASGKVVDKVAGLVTSLLREGTPIVEVQTMLAHIGTKVKFAVMLCLTEHRKREKAAGVPAKVTGVIAVCSAKDCSHSEKCANHITADEYRLVCGDTPALFRADSEWKCTKQPDNKGAGAIRADGNPLR